MTMTAPSHVFDVGQENFESEVLQASLNTPTLLDFGTPRSEASKALGPLLEKLAAEYNGAFRLGKVDVDQHPSLAQMFGIRSIPTVILVKEGQIADGFAGAPPEEQIREFLAAHVQPAEGAPEDIAAPVESAAETVARLRGEIAAEPDRSELKLDLALALMQAGQADDAETELNALPANLATDARAVRLRNQLDLARALEDAPAASALVQRIEADGDDWQARDLLGVRLLLEGDAPAGLEQFLTILQKARDWNEGQAKKRLLAAFNTLDDAELVGKYRRRMASLLF